MPDGFQKIAIGSRHHPHIQLDRRRAAHAHHLPLLQHAQQLGLKLDRHFADLIQKQRTALRHFDAAFLLLVRACECAFLVAEQLAFEHGAADGRAIDSDERTLAPRTALV